MVLAGGEGKRLAPLTDDRAKPAVPFGGNYRLIDFVLSNLVNGGYRRMVVLTQYKSHSLDRHISQTWRLSPMIGNYVATVPAQMRRGPRWFAGSADAIFQSVNLIHDEEPDYVLVFGADHIYRMDPRQMVEQHIDAGAAVTVAGIRVPVGEASEFGVIAAGPDHRIASFLEKPADPPSIPGSPHEAFASMGNYVFTTEALLDVVTSDAADEASRHDLGGNIIPSLVASRDAAYYDFSENRIPGVTDDEVGYWRDVGTLDAYYEANIDLVSIAPQFNLYNREWPVYTWHDPLPPAKFVFDDDLRRGQAVESMVSAGVIVSGSTVRRSVLSPGVRLHSGALVEDSVLLNGVSVGEGAVVRRAILDKQVVVEPGATVGVDSDRDREHYTMSDKGVVVVGKHGRVPAGD
jgi:glucose-1-phosphate adenylyltransferase